MDINIRKNSGYEPEEPSFAKAMEGEKEENIGEEWDMPVSAEGREAPFDSRNQKSPISGIDNNGKFKDSDISTFQNLNISKYQDARPKVSEVTVPIGFPKALNYWGAIARWPLIIFAGLAPIFFLPFTALPVAANKEILGFTLILP